MKLRVKDVRKMWENNLATLVAGKDGLDRIVEYYDVMEHPDIVPWLRENLIVITTGYAIKNQKNKLIELIENMNKINASALAIKTRFFDEFPKEVLSLADKLNFPLFFLNNDKRFTQIIHPLMVSLVLREHEDRKNIKNYNIISSKKEYNNRFFLDLYTKKITEIEEASYRANELGWPQGKIRIALIKLNKGEVFSEKLKYELLRSVKRNFRNYNVKTKIIFMNNNFIFILKDSKKEIIEDIFKNIIKELDLKLKNEFVAIISSVFKNYLELLKIYDSLKQLYKIKDNIKEGKVILWSEDFIFERMLLDISGLEIVDEFVLCSLYQLDESLIKTLSTYIKNNAQKQKTSEELYLHRNTVSYRLKKIEGILNVDLTNVETLSRLAVAIELKKYMTVRNAQKG